MVTLRKRITISLNAGLSADKAILDFLSCLPRKTRSDVIKEILIEALEKKDDPQKTSPPSLTQASEVGGIDPEDIIEGLF